MCPYAGVSFSWCGYVCVTFLDKSEQLLCLKKMRVIGDDIYIIHNVSDFLFVYMYSFCTDHSALCYPRNSSTDYPANSEMTFYFPWYLFFILCS